MRHPIVGLLLGAAVLLALPSPARTQPATGDNAAFDVERADAIPTRDPGATWTVALRALPADTTVRRIAFADHGINVLHTPPGESRVFATFFHRLDGALQSNPPAVFEGQACVAPGVAVARVRPALDRLLASPQWRNHRDTLDSLILECHDATVFWWLLLTPAGGLQAGVPLDTVRLPFEP